MFGLSVSTGALTAPIPTVESLAASQHALLVSPTPDYLPWIRDVLFFVDRIVSQEYPGGNPPEGPVVLPNSTLARIAVDAVTILHSIADRSAPAPRPEAFYLRGTLRARGAFPAQFPHNPHEAFRDFETAARAGYAKAWFSLGCDYEKFDDVARARDCFERGIRAGAGSCFYRMGMAHLLGQLGLPVTPQEALSLLSRAATLASIDTPQPPYVFALLLLGKFDNVVLDKDLFTPFIPTGSTPLLEARKFIERAAFLGFAPAQYKLGYAYEHAVPPFPFDPLLSVRYYSLASQQGEPEADLALSKWFLYGAEDVLTKDEALAFAYADKAARKGLGSAEFAMGYYAEIGIGNGKDIDAARKWYAKAVDHGNADASERLAGLLQSTLRPLTRSEHDAIMGEKLKRQGMRANVATQAAGEVTQTPQDHGEHGVINAYAQPREQAHHVLDDPTVAVETNEANSSFAPGAASPTTLYVGQARHLGERAARPGRLLRRRRVVTHEHIPEVAQLGDVRAAPGRDTFFPPPVKRFEIEDAFPRNTELCLDGRITRESMDPDHGGYSDVYEGTLESRKVAIKVVRILKFRREKLLRRLWREYLAWSGLSHPNILPCLGYSYDFSPGTVTLPSLISPWMENGTLTSYLETHPDEDRIKLLIGVANGLSYLHVHKPVIVHGDIRAGNILISAHGVPYLTDFGLSRILDEVQGLTTTSELAGSMRWMSPELFQSDGAATVHSDIWAYDMTVLEVLSGKRPYYNVKSDLVVLGQVRDGKIPPRPPSLVIDGVWETCKRCWSLDPITRPSMNEVASLLSAPLNKAAPDFEEDKE